MEESFTEKNFDELDLKPELLRAVAEMGFQKLTPVQAEAIPLMLEGIDVIGQAQTGTGKTAAFGLPILQKTDPDCGEVQALILCPTRELAVQVANEIRNYAAFMHGVKTLPVYGGQDIVRQISGLKGTQIVVGTPGRVMDHMRRHTLKLDNVNTVVLDEADEMLDMGFRDDMELILGEINHPHQTSLYSATMPQEILDLAEKFLKDPVRVRITQEELTISNIEQFYYSVKREYKVEALLRLIAFYNYKKCMIFCNTKTAVDNLVSELQKNGCMAEALHGDLSQYLRDAVMKRFRENDSCVLAATDIAARGIDVGDVEAVFNYDIPQEAEYYVHRIGRTGRAGNTGVSHTLVGSREFRKIHFIESMCHTEITERTVPTPEEIEDSKQLQALDLAYGLVASGNASDYLLRVHSFCNEHGITPEELAAAFLSLKVGPKTEALDIDLPAKKDKKRENGRRSRGDRYENHGDRSENSSDRLRSRYGRNDNRGDRYETRGERSENRDSRRENRSERRGNLKKAPETGFEFFARKEKDKQPYDFKAQEEELKRFQRRTREDCFKTGSPDTFSREYKSDDHRTKESGRRQKESGRRQKETDRRQKETDRRTEKEDKFTDSFSGYRDKQPSGRYGENAPEGRFKDKSRPDKSDKKENKNRSRRILAQAVKDVNSKGRAVPSKKRKAPPRNKH